MSPAQVQELWGIWPYAAILLLAAAPTHLWRILGVLMAGRLSEESEIFVFVKAVATALVAALIARLILYPSGPLASLPMAVRVAAAGTGFAAYVLLGRRLALGIAAAELVILAAWLSLR